MVLIDLLLLIIGCAFLAGGIWALFGAAWSAIAAGVMLLLWVLAVRPLLQR